VLFEGKKVDAIKKLREQTGLGAVEATRIVESWNLYAFQADHNEHFESSENDGDKWLSVNASQAELKGQSQSSKDDVEKKSPVCKLCKSTNRTEFISLNENISFVFGRRERSFAGDLCLRCMTNEYFSYTGRTLVGTWFGIIGMFVGPAYILGNTFSYIYKAYRLWKRR